MAKRVADRGGENRILKRGAMLHADTAMLAPAESTRPRRFAQPGPSAITLRFTDGQEAGLEEAASHWEMGRRLLDKIRTKGAKDLRPDPGADETARLWYLAGAAHMQRIQNLHPWHVERSVQLFPQDPEILFFAACLHEALSGPQFRWPRCERPDVHFDIGPRVRSSGMQSGCSANRSSATRCASRLESGWAACWGDGGGTRRLRGYCVRR
jgi:hypothetical protein